jgi:hypothetical protein
MGRWELINPSDYYEVECDNFKSAAVAACLVGAGKYGLKPISDTNEEWDMPLFILGGSDEWFKSTFGESVEAAFTDCRDNKLESLIHALKSINIEDSKRSSINNIGARAKSIADKLSNTLHK